MQNQEVRLEIDATHFTPEQVCELLSDVLGAIKGCVKMGHSGYLRLECAKGQAVNFWATVYNPNSGGIISSLS
jgi:hypothetical protein